MPGEGFVTSSGNGEAMSVLLVVLSNLDDDRLEAGVNPVCSSPVASGRRTIGTKSVALGDGDLTGTSARKRLLG